MAISAPTDLTEEQTSTSSTAYTTVSLSPAANALVFIIVCLFDNNSDPGSITITDSFSGGLGSWTDVIENQHSTEHSFSSFSWALATGSPGSGTITATSGTANISRWVVYVGEFASGFDTSTPIEQSKSEEETPATTQSITLDTTITSGNAVLAYVHNENETGGDGVTPGTDFSEIADFGTGPANNDPWLEVEYDLGPADETADWSALSSSASYCQTGAFEIDEAAGGETAVIKDIIGGGIIAFERT